MWLRSANKDDLQAVHQLLVKTWHATFDDVLGAETVNKVTGEYHSIAALSRNLAKPYSEFVVADDGEGRLVGMAFASQSKQAVAQLHQLYVDPEYHIQGIGTMLLAEMETAFPDVEKLALEVIAKNHKAVEFYRRKGFEKTGETTDWGTLELDILIYKMEKPLAGWSV
ncbi:GNAT family N-acetyltransferase [Pseudochrobactrum sp. HB0163]|uniref:GNAT family N-acetyltransferase n=1 Tax=Pseudochrobactrum sp. HB0163 TaxID=3450708 RepID=UPI003F6DE84A